MPAMALANFTVLGSIFSSLEVHLLQLGLLFAFMHFNFPSIVGIALVNRFDSLGQSASGVWICC